ncbi:phenylacetate-CoA ligase [Aquipseudomonas alcaligenes]|uniref:Phenylacetate-CoA ligase n=2 Tax=Aquipseudomonas alcaligenes TaxID=43263 RepID=A0A1N6XU98_AQUAC|nr:phenylacetate-CoA ligase [Pseudomonas alcaligenes]
MSAAGRTVGRHTRTDNPRLARMSLPSEIPEIVWPPLYQVRQAALQALLQQLEQIERAPLTEIIAGQEQQLQVLNNYLYQFSPAHRQRLVAAGLDPSQPLTLEGLRQLPPIRRRDVQSAGQTLYCSQVPQAHLPIAETHTSGSSGEPVAVRRTQVNQLFWLAHTMRDHLWWQRDRMARLASVRGSLPQTHMQQDNWGPPASLLGPSGVAHAFSVHLDTAPLAHELAKADPHYLLIYPTALQDLLRHLRLHGGGLPALRQIRCIGETLSEELRSAAREQLGVEIVDSYSSQEVGIIALQCPTTGLYHIMADNLIVEILDDAGHACATGEVGEVVVSDLHNFATPLLRYAIGDHAEVGPPCSCGRNLPTLRRILGRSRNMVRYPDGSRRWPDLGFVGYRKVAPVQQYQVVQHSLEEIEVRLVVERALTDAEQSAISQIILESLAHPFCLSFRYFADSLPRGPGGKFEEFVCLCD